VLARGSDSDNIPFTLFKKKPWNNTYLNSRSKSGTCTKGVIY
jgi:hypothetical protein